MRFSSRVFWGSAYSRLLIGPTTDDDACEHKVASKTWHLFIASFTHTLICFPLPHHSIRSYPYLYVAYIRSVGLHRKTSFYKLKACFYLSELLIVIALPRSSLTYFQVLISRLSGAYRSVQMPITRESIFDRIRPLSTIDHTMRTVFFALGTCICSSVSHSSRSLNISFM